MIYCTLLFSLGKNIVSLEFALQLISKSSWASGKILTQDLKIAPFISQYLFENFF